MFWILLLTLTIIGIVAATEVLAPGAVTEGFQTLLPRTSYWSHFISPRYDIGPDQEDFNFVRDVRFFNDYADVSRIGQNYDFCRMIAPVDDEDNKFFACALAGTENLDSTTFRTENVKEGFRISRDDYMRDINGDGRADYCRILKWKDGTYQPVCARAGDFKFDNREVIDGDPPADIVTLLSFYQGASVWLRFMDDLKDTMDSVTTYTAGNLAIDERPHRETTEGLSFNGKDQFLRIADSPDLSLGFTVPLRSIRAWMVWVYFDTFTNNAKIFDFGNGPGKDNVFLGILGKGDSTLEDASTIRPLLCDNQNTVPEGNTGAQPVLEMSPQRLMKTTDANVDEFTCTGFEVQPRRLKPSFPIVPTGKKSTKASLLFEVWDHQARKMRLLINNIMPKGKWTHVCITAMDNDAFRPDYSVYVNGKVVIQRESGWLPAASSMTNCYLGKSNWANSVSQYENRDELFHGKLFDFRMYKTIVAEDMLAESIEWGKKKLSLV